MPPKLTVSQNVINRLSNVKEECTGNLYGVLYKDTILILGFHVHEDDEAELIHGFPTEIDIYGVLEVGEGITSNKISQVINDIDVTDTPIYLSCVHDRQPNSIQAYFHINNRLESATFEVIPEHEIYTKFVHIRLMTQLPFISGVTLGSIKESFSAMRKNLTHGQVVFNFPKTNVYMMGNNDNENELIGLTGEPSVGEICKQSIGNTEGCVPNNKKKKEQSLDMDVLRVTMFKKITRDMTMETPKCHAPVVHIDKRVHQAIMFPIKIDALSIVHRQAKVVELYGMLVESCCRYLRLLEAKVVENFHECKGDYTQISEPETFHFFPEQCGHFITRAYTKNDSEENLENRRLILHKQLVLPFTHPFFRRGNQFIFKEDIQDSSKLLVNPHEGINSAGNGGEIALVKGKYRYYHYGQDNTNDTGWGCAYRSLQTLVSWFILQGYTDKDVPSIVDIQKCLVNIGDKPADFIGSKQWIGSMEVNFVLSTLLNVTSKILYVSSGEETGAKGPELIHHFKTQGTPVMIGGGILAQTILGVDYNNVSGELWFLILDPHYTGNEDLTIVQKKGWCGWKNVDFWDKSAYYNMCLPQVPECI